jgi:hypothetical protein
MFCRIVFLHPVRSAGHVVHYGAPGARNIDALFFELWWDWDGFDKKHDGTCDTKLVFLHPVGSAGHVVRSSASEARNIDAEFFLLRCP